jgi:hypothetical protein
LADADQHGLVYQYGLAYQATQLPTRLAIVFDVMGGRLKVGELRLRSSRMRFPTWGKGTASFQ